MKVIGHGHNPTEYNTEVIKTQLLLKSEKNETRQEIIKGE